MVAAGYRSRPGNRLLFPIEHRQVQQSFIRRCGLHHERHFLLAHTHPSRVSSLYESATTFKTLIVLKKNMKLELPGQCRGKDAGRTMKPKTRLRKEYEDKFRELGVGTLKEISPILRVDGELGSFGKEGIENVKIRDGEAECDLVIPAQNWNDMSEDEIYSFLKPRVIESFRVLLREAGIESPPWLGYEKESEPSH